MRKDEFVSPVVITVVAANGDSIITRKGLRRGVAGAGGGFVVVSVSGSTHRQQIIAMIL